MTISFAHPPHNKMEWCPATLLLVAFLNKDLNPTTFDKSGLPKEPERIDFADAGSSTTHPEACPARRAIHRVAPDSRYGGQQPLKTAAFISLHLQTD